MTTPQNPAELLAQVTIQPGGVVCVEGQQADHAYVILQGEVQAVADSAHGKRVALSRMRAGEMFGEIGLLRADGKRTATIVSEGGCRLLVIPRAIFDDRLERADPLLNFMIGHLLRRVTALTDRVVEHE